MNIDDLFLAITDELRSIPELKWIDMNIGQMDGEDRPPVAFPCALVSIDLPECKDIGQNKQQCRTTLNVRVAFNYRGATNSAAPEIVRGKALEYYGIVRKVYQALHGFKSGDSSPFRRKSQMEYARPDQIRFVDLMFECQFIDASAA